uniref:EF-hand domain-containing protein n=1 Tax=Lotharella oceanica TaxID=641309 RepID=A0A7S2TY09_9EUKA
MSGVQYLKVKNLKMVKTLALIKGLEPETISNLLQAAFGTSSPVVALIDQSQDLVVPISVIVQRPEVFSQATFALLAEGEQVPPPPPPRRKSKSEVDQKESTKGDAEPVPTLKLNAREVDRIHETRETTLLSKLSAEQVRAIFDSCARKNGTITKEGLAEAVENFIPGEGLAHHTHVQRTVNEIMEVFDRDGNGVVDAKEFLVGMSVLCKGSTEEKVCSVFKALDTDGDGYITLTEMVDYMICFFKTAFSLSQTKLREGISPMKLGYATALACFEEADVNRDGRISFQEFQTWYKSKSTPGTLMPFFEVSDPQNSSRMGSSSSS